MDEVEKNTTKIHLKSSENIKHAQLPIHHSRITPRLRLFSDGSKISKNAQIKTSTYKNNLAERLILANTVSFSCYCYAAACRKIKNVTLK